jgi:hypothetical protein
MGTCVAVALVIFLAEITAPGQESPRQVLDTFCEMDAQGKELTAEGWREVRSIFTQPRATPDDRIIVIRDFVVSRPAPFKDGVTFYIEYVYVGQLDKKGPRFTRLPDPYPRGPVKVRIEYILKQTDGGGKLPKWRIDGSPREPHISIDTAIRYVTEIRNGATNPAIVKSADQAIAALKRVK